MQIELKNEKRPCIVYGRYRKDLTRRYDEATFHGIYQSAHVKNAILIGETGGQIAGPVAVVEINGLLKCVHVGDVEFTDVAKNDEVEDD